MNINFVIFTDKNCGHCEQLKLLLSYYSIPFHELDIYENKYIWDEVVKQTHINGTPIVYFLKDEGDGEFLIPLRDYNTIPELVNIIKKRIR